jgi:hypothetical protein
MAQRTAVVIRNADKARKSVLQFDVVLVFMALFFRGFYVKVKNLRLAVGVADPLLNESVADFALGFPRR